MSIKHYFHKQRPKRGGSLYQHPIKGRSDDEEMIAYRRLILVTAGVVAISLFLYFWGIPLVASLGEFWQNIRPSSTVTVPQPDEYLGVPHLTALPSAFNDLKEFIVQGWTSAGLKVILYTDGKEAQTTVADASGHFQFGNLELTQGSHTFAARVQNQTGYESSLSEEQVAVYDLTPPSLTILTPADGQTFDKPDDEWTTISGTTEAKARVFINDWQARVDTEGDYEYSYRLEKGENKLLIKAVDEAGNESKKEISVSFVPPEETE